MMNNDKNEELNVTGEELQRWVRTQVDKDERLVRRQAQLAQVEEWVKQKEMEATYNRMLYSNACESVLECESVMKGLYGMLGLEYHDTDSEEEEGAKSTENVIHVQDEPGSREEENNDDDDPADMGEDDTADVDDDYVVIDLGAAANETARDERELCQEKSPAGMQSPGSSEKTLVRAAKRPAFVNPQAKTKSITPSRSHQSLAKPTVPTVPTTNPAHKDSSPLSDGSSIASPVVATDSTTHFAPTCSTEGSVSQSGSFTQTSRLSGNSGTGSSETDLPDQRPVSSHTSSTTHVKNKTEGIKKLKHSGSKPSKKSLSSPRSKPNEPSSSANSKPTDRRSRSADPKPTDRRSRSADPKPVDKSSDLASLKPGINPSSPAGPKPSSANLKPSNEPPSSANPKPRNEPPSSASPKPRNELVDSASPEPSNDHSGSDIPEPSNEHSGSVNPKPSKDPLVSSSTKSSNTPAVYSIFETKKKKTKSVSPTPSKKTSSSFSPTPSNKPLKSASPKTGKNTVQSTIPKSTHEPSNTTSPKLTKKSLRSASPKASIKPSGPSSSSSNLPVPSNEPSSTPSPEPSNGPSNSTTSSASTSSSTTVKTKPTEKSDDPNQGNTEASASQTPNIKTQTSSPVTSTQPGTSTTVNSASDSLSNNKEGSETSSVPAAVPASVQQEIELKVNMSILGKRRTKTWHQGTILDIKTTETGPRYKVLFEGNKGKSVLSAHHLACVGPPLLKDLSVGCRVVASYKELDQSWFLAAIVAEMPDRKNRMRFLVFFDDGHSAYIALPDLHLVCKPVTNVCDDIDDKEWHDEMKEYLQSYPNPIFVVMRVGQESKALRDGKMEPCVITQVDSSLIEVKYKKDQEKEWLYKGSNRLEQIQRIKMRMAEQKKEQSISKAGWMPNQKSSKPATTTTTTTSTTAATTSTTVTTDTTASKPSASQSDSSVSSSSSSSTTSSTSTSTTSSSSSTANKSVLQPKIILNRIKLPAPEPATDKQPEPTVQTEPTVTPLSSPGIMYPSPEEKDNTSHNSVFPLHMPRLKYVPHRCCPACLYQVRPVQRNQHHGQNPLLIPLLYGFRRMTARKRLDGKVSFHVFYRSPCGRSMCEMEEVQDFLFESRCDFLFLDMFCLDPFVLVKRAIIPSSMTSQPQLYLPDISEGKETIPVPCVNEVDSTRPDPLTYITRRQPAPGIFVNTNLDFMVGCDCTDGCRDRSKCACHQLTIDATSLFTGGPVDVTAGYTHKRLPRYVPTGVYECNPLCRCDPLLCGNRLVQHGLQLRFEVFMTQHKGWGIRCLDDISKGTFVCTFTGKIVTDEMISAKVATSGNEYLANLDYIEGVEKLKEGYESEAYCSEIDEESEKKTCVTMTTGALKKHGMFQLDASSSSGEVDDKLLNDVQKPSKISEEQTEVTASVAKQMRKEGPGDSMMGFAKKSTRAFAIKSSHRRVKPLVVTTEPVPTTKTVQSRKCTRSLFDGEKGCYLVDAKQEGNLARYINHSCSPNMFVQNVFVDTHDMRFPWVSFFTNKRIRAGTELTWDYGYEVGSVEGKVLLCCCGSAKCTGRLL
ncbi:histone-lysine N-methyltransferase SETDB1-A isoform X2 [Trichomycterus rosablanca]|uniref:histone-lysine N-methyltransferase SETDB1-A isoform X2 n=1 Tax=Trichomycterus rosablanca TaxID=2290929 RepID=UPI002F357D9A